jgi:hypothetical protein
MDNSVILNDKDIDQVSPDSKSKENDSSKSIGLKIKSNKARDYFDIKN